MRKLRVAGVVGAVGVALLLAACEEGPAAQPDRHEIEGTWKVEDIYGVRDGAEFRQPMPSGFERLITFSDGTYESRDKRSGSPWSRSLGTYIIDEQSRSIVVSLKFADGAAVNRVSVIEYELHGLDRAELRMISAVEGIDITIVWIVERVEDSN